MSILRCLLAGLAFAAMLLARPIPVQAQATPADTAAVLLGVASQLDAEGRRELAESILSLIRERYAGTPAAAEATRRLAALERLPGRRSGRVELIVWGTLYGLGLGFAVPYMLDAEGPEAYGLGLLVGGPAGFFAAKSYADGGLMGEGHARSITFGGMWGGWQGFGWQEVLDIGIDKRTEVISYCSGFDTRGQCTRTVTDTITIEEESGRAAVTAVVLGSLAGILAGDLLAKRFHPTPGTATLVNLGALWGTWYGLGTMVLLEVDGEDSSLAGTLIGGNIGLLATALAAPRWNMSRERARLISIAGVAGLVAGGGIDLLVQPNSDEVAILIPMVTSALGLGLGAAWTKDYDRRRGGSGPGGEGGALLNVDGGHFAMGLPAPTPVLLRSDDRMDRRRIGLRLKVLEAKF